ncbi:MAG: EscU/YscU/HrcU family type III secretion system export apparatus switch protein [Leptospiraceae bacterium]|nr:EscU/YscU/HrcU family type III secretion system export apparatus switch protein [Leptospiraceae bacterium]
MKKAIALRFLPDSDLAPRLVAKGEGILAEQILKIAERKDVHIIQDKSLAESLSRLGLGVEIPDNLYKAVSVVFRYIWEQEKKDKGE